jgi:PEP-CTERM motif
MVAGREGIGIVLTGSVSARGNGYTIGVRAIDSANGNVLATADSTVPDKASVLKGVEAVASKLRRIRPDARRRDVLVWRGKQHAGPAGLNIRLAFQPAIWRIGSGILATITFQTLMAGNSGLQFANVFLFDSGSPEGTPIPVDLLPGDVTVTAVPEPSTLVLVGLGLAALRRARKRRSPPPV